MKNLWSIEDLFENNGVFERQNQAPDVSNSDEHAVLFELPLPEDESECPVPNCEKLENEKDFQVFVKLPCSEESFYYEINDQDEKVRKLRWDLIKESLTKNKIENSRDLESCIKSYNTKYENIWNFASLHEFFEDELLETEADMYFEEVIPKLIDLALELPNLIKRPIPYLTKGNNSAISMSRQQAACILANGFLCTFPNRNVARKSTDYPEINFSRLFCSNMPHVVQKIKCICYYFRRILSPGQPLLRGVLTFQRRYIPKVDFPKWSESDLKFSTVRWHCDSRQTIEDAQGMLQVDFANKYLGGGVLGFGCVQEEIRFVICPELIVGMLFCESMSPEETILIFGAEQFCSYSGYSSSFKWEGNFIDATPSDKFRRKLTSIVAMDALSFHKPRLQFEEFLLIREVNKAYCGFYHDKNSPEKSIPVASGNWGCGAFRGDKHLKSLLQLIACVANKRNLVYYTFRDDELMNDICQMFSFLQENEVTIGQVWRCLTMFKEQRRSFHELYQYIYEQLKNQEQGESESSKTQLCVQATEETFQNPAKRTKMSDDGESEMSKLTDLCEKLNEKVSSETEQNKKEPEEVSKQATILNYFKSNT